MSTWPTGGIRPGITTNSALVSDRAPAPEAAARSTPGIISSAGRDYGSASPSSTRNSPGTPADFGGERNPGVPSFWGAGFTEAIPQVFSIPHPVF